MSSSETVGEFAKLRNPPTASLKDTTRTPRDRRMSHATISRATAARATATAATAATVALALACAATAAPLQAQDLATIDDRVPTNPYISGGELIRAQAAYDVTFYDLTLAVEPADSTIEGAVEMTARITQPTDDIAMDLDTLLAIESVKLLRGPHDPAEGEPQELTYERLGGRFWIDFPHVMQPGDEFTVRVAYGGHPRIAPNPPWDGGFQWAETPSGAPWIATSNQLNGADVWWPNKDHVSDKPDSVGLHITVPVPLVVATNGRQIGMEPAGDAHSTYHWFVSTPISNYNVSLNIAPYRKIESEMESVAGDTFPVVFYVLAEDLEKGQVLFPEIVKHVAWFESKLGPYPFRADKYGVAQTPHLGMEHQTIIAYGANFNNGSMTGGVDWGFDALHHHELGHEWWGNLVTNTDWKDMWVHEGIDTYMQALYLEDEQGIERYHEYMASMAPRIRNRLPVAPYGATATGSGRGGDIYFKGAWTLHAVRRMIGKADLMRALRLMAYEDEAMWEVTDGSQVRFAGTSDFESIVAEVSGQDLGWLFDVYLREAELPRLMATHEEDNEGTTYTFEWVAPNERPFPMPVDVAVDGRIQTVDMTDGTGVLRVPARREVVVDPERWILRARPRPGSAPE